MIVEALVRHGTLEGKELAALIASLALPGGEALGEERSGRAMTSRRA